MASRAPEFSAPKTASDPEAGPTFVTSSQSGTPTSKDTDTTPASHSEGKGELIRLIAFKVFWQILNPDQSLDDGLLESSRIYGFKRLSIVGHCDHATMNRDEVVVHHSAALLMITSTKITEKATSEKANRILL